MMTLAGNCTFTVCQKLHLYVVVKGSHFYGTSIRELVGDWISFADIGDQMLAQQEKLSANDLFF